MRNDAMRVLSDYVGYGDPQMTKNALLNQSYYNNNKLEFVRKQELKDAQLYYEDQMVSVKNKDVPKVKEHYELIKAQILAHFEKVELIFKECDEEDYVVFLNDPNVVVDGLDMPCVYKARIEDCDETYTVFYPSFAHKQGREYQLVAVKKDLPFKRWVFTSTMSEDVQYSEKFADYTPANSLVIAMTISEAAMHNFRDDSTPYTVDEESLNEYIIQTNRHSRFFRCKDCNDIFELTESNIQWFKEKGIQIPARCIDCRRKRRDG